MAALGVLRSLAASAPLILAIDDVHWIDPSSARVLGFAVRRLKDERVGILATARTGLQIPLELSQALDRVTMRRVTVGPMAAEGTWRLAPGPSRYGPASPARRPAPRDLRREPVLCSGDRSGPGAPGCPSGPGRTTPGAGRPPAVARISPRCASVLLRSSRSSRSPRRPGRRRISSSRSPDGRTRRWPVSGQAEAASVIRREGGSIRFTHPLLGSTVYAAATPQTKRRLHGRLAELVLDIEERASHLALSTTGPDADVAEALEEAAQHARARGAPDAAAGLGELARQLTPLEDEEGLRRRSMDAAEYHFDAGDAPRAIALLEEAAASSPSRSWASGAPVPSLVDELDEPRTRRPGPARAGASRGGRRPRASRPGSTWTSPGSTSTRAILPRPRSTRDDRSINRTGSSTPRPRPMPSRRSGWWSSCGQTGGRLDVPGAGTPGHRDEGGSWTEASVYTTPRSIVGLQQMWAGSSTRRG